MRTSAIDIMHTLIVRGSHAPQTKAWVLSAVDRAMLMHTLRGTWVFDYQPDEQALIHSLSQLLSLYPQLSGRMVKGRLIRLINEGVPFHAQKMPNLTRTR